MVGRDLDLNIAINARDNTAQALAKARQGVEGINTQLASLRLRLNQLAGISLGSLLGGQIASQALDILKTADAYKTLEARLRIVSDNSKEFADAQRALFDIAQRTRSDLSSIYDLYGNLETSIKQLGGTQAQAISTTETLAKALALTSQGAAQDSAAILQFSQALANGVLRGDEFNSVMESSPGLAQALAEGLGVPVGKLREMAEAGELTSDKLINALSKAAPAVAEKFNQLPLTVSGALTKLSNSFTKYIGEADKGAGISSKVASAIEAVANNLNVVAAVALTAAEVLGAKLLVSLAQSVKSYIESAKAAKEKAEADEAAKEAAVELLKQNVLMAGIHVKTAKYLVDEAKLQKELADTEIKRVESQKALIEATGQLNEALAEEKEAQDALNESTSDGEEATTGFVGAIVNIGGKFAKFAGIAGIVYSGVSNVLGALSDSSERVRLFAIAWEYAGEKVVAVAKHFLSLEFLNGNDALTKKLDELKVKYDDLANEALDSTQQIKAAEEERAKAADESALKQKESFKVVQDASKELISSVDADLKLQTANIKLALEQRLAVVDAADLTESEKATAKLEARLESYAQEVLLQQQASEQKLQIIDAEYAQEEDNAKNNSAKIALLEQQKQADKRAVYQGLAEYYQQELGRLNQVYESEIQAAQQSRNALQDLAQSHEQRMFEISLEGLDQREQLSKRQDEFDKKIREAKAEQQKGEAADQDKINRLLAEADALQNSIRTTASQSDSDQSRHAENEKKYFEAKKVALEADAKSHEANAERVKAAQEDVLSRLNRTLEAIKSISESAGKDLAIKITADQGSLSYIENLIKRLTAPAEKIITIRTVNESGSANNAQPKPSAKGFNRGGHIPGFGGGDIVNAFLEPGEFVVRKESVKNIGLPIIKFINERGKIPKFAKGGLFGGDEGGGNLASSLQNLLRLKFKLQEQIQAERNRHPFATFGELNTILSKGEGLRIKLADEEVNKRIAEIQQKLAKTGNELNIISHLDTGGAVSSSFGRYKIDGFLNGQKVDLFSGGFGSALSAAIGSSPLANLPSQDKPKPPTQSSQKPSRGGVLSPEVIKLDLSFQGRTVTGEFPRNDQTKAVIDAIKRAGFSSR